MSKTKNVPKNAMIFNVGEFAISDKNGESAKSAPLELKARSGQPINHAFWGKVAHDLSGMKLHKARLAVDYAHDSTEVIGYLNKFDISSGDLIANGALVPFKNSDRATEVIYKSSQGVPYEASIYFDGAVVEEVAEGFSAEVNGYQLEGPATIIREWNLRGVAVCPYGYDSDTETRLAAGGDECTVKLLEGNKMSKPAEETAPESVDADSETETEEVVSKDELSEDVKVEEEAEEATVESTEDETEQVEEEAEEAEEATVEPTADELSAPGQKYMDAFGKEKGAVWFAQGKSFDEAETMFNASIMEERDSLAAEVVELRGRLSALSSAGADAVSGSGPAPEKVTGQPEADFMELSRAYAADNKCTMTKAMKDISLSHPAAFAAQKKGK